MRFTKPAWVVHKDAPRYDQSAKRLSIFSVHVHPDGSRIATGGLDAKIRIWSTKPILNHASELSNRPPKSLCTLAMHTGPVLTVRWAHSGKWLASGSDDEIVMIWDLDPTGAGKVWGSEDVNVEGWKPLKRLPGHESDVTDVAWAPGDRYLASVGLDSQVMIWCGYTLERLRKLGQHQGFVKGVCWDPVGEFLATQSDDRSVKIWRTTDWQLEAEIRKPFEDSPGSTFFRRLSWSPDGAHITASNATNNKGFVFIAAVISRNTWTSEISLVGHENTVEVAAYNPHIFLRNPDQPIATSNICSVVALGADDRSVSVWQTKSARPLIVAKEVFERQILDLSWSWDGLALYAVSSDGTMGVFHFDPEELEGLAPQSAQTQYLQKFGFVPPPLPAEYSHYGPAPTSVPAHASQSSTLRNTPPPSPPHAPSSQSQNGFGAPGTNGHGPGEYINKLVAKRGPKNKDKKRIQPSFVGSLPGSIPSASTSQHPHPTSSSNFGGAGPSHGFGNLSSSSSIVLPPPPPMQSINGRSVSSAGPPLQHSHSHGTGASHSNPFASGMSTTDGFDVDMDFAGNMDFDAVPIDALDTSASAKGKQRAGFGGVDDSRLSSKPRTLGGDRPREVVVVRELSGASSAHWTAPSGSGIGVPSAAVVLDIPPLKTLVGVKVEGSDDTFEGRNSEDANTPTEVIFVSGKQTQWLDYLPSPVVAVVATSAFCAAAMLDGSLNVYSLTGRRLMPTLSLCSPCSFLGGSKSSLMALTSSGQLYVWNVKKQHALFAPVSIYPLLGSSPNCTVHSVLVRPNGATVIQLSSGVAHSYDPALSSWVKLSETWWAEGSDAWQGRQRSGGNTQLARGVLASVEGTISEMRMVTQPDDADKQRPTWWSAALTLGHLETRLHAAKALDSPQEYKQALLLYAKKIADEGFRGKGEELVKELFGPLYWRPGRDDSWSPNILGMAKRDLLKDVLVVFARSKTLTKLALDWQDTLKKAAVDE